MQPSTLSAAVMLLTLLSLESAAIAAPPADVRAVAEQLYQDAYELDRAGRYAEACPKLEESDRLDPANGTKLELAQCYASTRRPASAWVLYVTVAGADHVSGKNPEREAQARARAQAIEPDLPMLTITVPAEVANLPGIEIRRDGVVLGRPAWGTPVPIDLGEHRITVSAQGDLLWEGRSTVTKLRERVEIQIPPLRREAPSPSRWDALSREGPARRALLFTAGGVGVAGVALGSAFGATAISSWSDVKATAQSECADPIHFKGCSTKVASQRDDASRFATVSTVGFAVAGVAVAGMAVLLLSGSPRAPRGARIQITPSVGPSGALGLVRGTF